ncbi:hypothetical protein BB934_45490 (plasmid) [Microvirga ossetica]|uniref:Uncharacterized protein n=1 Tax=Microvirga ossetica TaxID=1882682 RepID=A0A1B2EZT3_9HYPH|nr:hypothetical protein [Microvirga ossetica]ANY85476.1 hypothetical protein BB934_45490 [Microvirga ossetica]
MRKLLKFLAYVTGTASLLFLIAVMHVWAAFRIVGSFKSWQGAITDTMANGDLLVAVLFGFLGLAIIGEWTIRRMFGRPLRKRRWRGVVLASLGLFAAMTASLVYNGMVVIDTVSRKEAGTLALDTTPALADYVLGFSVLILPFAVFAANSLFGLAVLCMGRLASAVRRRLIPGTASLKLKGGVA